MSSKYSFQLFISKIQGPYSEQGPKKAWFEGAKKLQTKHCNLI